MNLSTNSASYLLRNMLSPFYSASLKFYTGTMPASPETALSSNTLLATFTFATAAFAFDAFTGGFERYVASFVAASVTPVANGTVTFARAAVTSTAWAISTVYARGQVVTNNSNLYVCISGGTSAGSGGPTTTADAITDNTVIWSYFSASSGQNGVLGDFTVGTSGADIIIANTALVTTVNVQITSFKLQLPAV